MVLVKDVYHHPDVDALIAVALREDLAEAGDLTCRALVPPWIKLDGVVRAKAEGVVCGLALFQRVFAAIATSAPGCDVEVVEAAADGTAVRPGDVVLRCHGNAATMLIGERTALNLCQRLSGTATMARRYAEAVAGTRAQVFDTRKTTPGLRRLEKHAVLAGGARNHRLGLYDQVLIKENHIALMPPGPLGSGPAEAVRRTREQLGPETVIEVEIERLDDLEPVIAAGADIVLLDNMGVGLLREAVARRDRACAAAPSAMARLRRVELEASGGITLATIRAVAETGVERISTGALTHSVQALDLSLRCTPAAEN
jgi:nicotinate-nucleotide pyrophosphorylase (carboxylating)